MVGNVKKLDVQIGACKNKSFMSGECSSCTPLALHKRR